MSTQITGPVHLDVLMRTATVNGVPVLWMCHWCPMEAMREAPHFVRDADGLHVLCPSHFREWLTR